MFFNFFYFQPKFHYRFLLCYIKRDATNLLRFCACRLGIHNARKQLKKKIAIIRVRQTDDGRLTNRINDEGFLHRSHEKLVFLNFFYFQHKFHYRLLFRFIKHDATNPLRLCACRLDLYNARKQLRKKIAIIRVRQTDDRRLTN